MIDLHAKQTLGPALRLHANDNVLVARTDIGIGAKLQGAGTNGADLSSRSQVPAGYKIAARALTKGEPIVKYDVTIGFAAADIPAGTLVHSHNIDFTEFDRDYAIGRDFKPVTMIPPAERATFQGIVRDDGRVATRNYICILSTVNCSATVVRRIAEWFTPERLARFPNIDGVVAFPHALGCGMERTGEAMAVLQRTLVGYARHPNLAAALIVGLGCERNQLQGLLEFGARPVDYLDRSGGV